MPISLHTPAVDTPLPLAEPSYPMLERLSRRRSTLARNMTAPGPSQDELETILQLATRVPDHGKLGPWRFIIFEGAARSRFGENLARIFRQAEPAADEQRIQFERDRLMRAPLVICVVSIEIPNHKVPTWEQQLSAGAVCQTMLLAADAIGYAAQWLTEWYSYDREIHETLGLNENERAAGFIYMGTASSEVKERQRPDWRNRVTRF